MKIELICRNCNGKMFRQIRSMHRTGGDNREEITFQCKRCKVRIDIIYYGKLQESK